MKLLRLALGMALASTTLVAIAQQFPTEEVRGSQATAQIYKDAMKRMGLDQKIGSNVDQTPMVFTETGQRIAFGSLLGTKPVILLPMFFTCKSACGIEVDGLLKSLAKMTDYTAGKDYDVIFLSINPKETPDVAMAKKQLLMQDFDRNGSGSGFHFLTGSLADVQKICQSVGFRYVWKPETEQIFHPTGMIILTKTGMISRYFYGTEYSPQMLQGSLVAAMRLQKGPQATPIMLGCIMVDPVTGARTLNIMRTTQVLGLLTLIILFGSMAVMNARHKAEIGNTPRGGTPA